VEIWDRVEQLGSKEANPDSKSKIWCKDPHLHGVVRRVRFAYEDLSSDQFETLVILICQRLLGLGVQGFASGPDGGRDARFIGIAQLYPSTVAPWSGTTIMQAKHTNGYNQSFSDKDFYSAQSTSTVIAKELPRIKKLRAANAVDNYFLFSNRKLTALANEEICSAIATECGIPPLSVSLCGLNSIELYMERFHEVPEIAGLDPIDSPLIISSDQIAELVEAMVANKTAAEALVDQPVSARTSYAEKNALNNMTSAYAKALQKKYLKDTAQIQAFFAAPENAALLRSYEEAVDEIQLKIIAARMDYQTFDKVMEYLTKLLFDRDAVLRQRGNQRLTRALLFYMYWHCDIGESLDAPSE
jgi:hypothetical protein